jgi:FkbM family methyltransferase
MRGGQTRIRRGPGRRIVSAGQIECKFDTLSEVIAQENIQSIGLLKLDAESADWEILNGVKAEDWNRIRQVAMRFRRQHALEQSEYPPGPVAKRRIVDFGC